MKFQNSPASLSVVIPTYNRPALVRRALLSIAAQTRDDIETIVVNDGSSLPYDFCNILPPERLRVLRNDHNLGPAAARNAGILAAQANWIAFLDDDDEWQPEFAAKCLSRLDEDSQSSVFSWSSVIDVHYDSAGRVSSEEPRRFKPDHDSEADLFGAALSIGTGFGMMVNRSCFETAGLFDDNYRLVEDTELILRLLANDCRPSVTASLLVKIHHHPGDRLTGSGRNAERASEIERMIEQHALFLDEYPDLRLGLSRCALALQNKGADATDRSVAR